MTSYVCELEKQMINHVVIIAIQAISTFLISGVVCPAIFAAETGTDQQTQYEIERFPIERDCVILVPVTVFGKEERFLIGTGGTTIVLDKRTFEERLGKPVNTVVATDALTPLRIPLFRRPPIIVGSRPSFATEDGGLIGSIDLSPLKKHYGKDISGAIGMDFLKSKVLRVDFVSGYASFLKEPSNAFAESERLSFLNTGSPSIRVQVADSGFHTFMVDTGFNGSLALEPGLFGKLLKTKQIELRENGRAIDLGGGGKTKLRRGILSSVAVGSFQICNVNVNETPINTVGLAFLERFVSEFDFPNRKLFLYRNNLTNLPEPRTLCGFGVARVNQLTVVDDVDDPARDAVVQKDDVILTVNDTPAGRLSLSQIRILCTVPDSKLKLTLQRDGVRFDVALDLKRIPDPFPSVVSEVNAIPSGK
jgi:predicted aspartyl protease